MSIAQSAFNSMVGRIKYYFNTHGYTKTVKICENLGEAVNDYTEENTDTVVSSLYGICRQQSSQVSAMTESLHMVTGTALLEFLVDAIRDADGKYTELDQIVELLQECSNYITGDWYETNTTTGDDNNISCAVFPVVSLPTVGIYQEASSNFGAYIPVSIQLYFTAVQGAMPPNGISLAIDGVEIPTIELVASRTKAATTDVHASSVTGSTTNSEESSTFEIQFSCPAHVFHSETLLSDLVSGKPNIPHCVTFGIKHPNIGGSMSWQGVYLMSTAKVQLTKNAGATVGINCNLLEIDPDAVEIVDPTRWRKTVLTVTSKSASILMSAGYWHIFWGDGSESSHLTNSGDYVSHTYAENGTYTVIYYKWE